MKNDRSKPLPYLLMLGADEEVGRAVLGRVDHQRAVGRKQPASPSGLVVLVRVAGAVHFLDARIPHRQPAQGALWTTASHEQ